MDRLKRFLAIPMAASAVAALWLLNRQAGKTGALIGVGLGLGILFALFEAGRLQRRGKAGAWGGAVAAILLVGIGVALMPRSGSAIQHVEGAEPWSEARVASYVQQRRPVFVYFTADWCLSCKVNEAAAIDRGEVRDAFRGRALRYSPETGPTATRRSRVSSKAGGARVCRSIFGTHRENRLRSCPRC